MIFVQFHRVLLSLLSMYTHFCAMVHGVPIGVPIGVPMGYLWGTYGVPMGYCHLTKILYNRYGVYGCTTPFKWGGWLLMFFTDKH